MGMPDEGSCRIVVGGSIVDKVEIELVVGSGVPSLRVGLRPKISTIASLYVPGVPELHWTLCSITHMQEETEHMQQTNSS